MTVATRPVVGHSLDTPEPRHPTRPGLRPQQVPDGIEVVHEDAHLLVLNKPSGLLAVPGRGPDNADCLSARVQAIYPDALVVHRLDMGTSGLMVMARSPAMQRQLSDAFAHRHVHKRYVAVVAGDPASSPLAGQQTEEGWQVINLPLIVDWPNRPRSKVCHETGKPSVTHWRPMGPQTVSGLTGTRLLLSPVTGRSHQLRVHLLTLGHPMFGDDLYAPDNVVQAAPRLLLHAQDLRLSHPATGQDMQWISACPF